MSLFVAVALYLVVLGLRWWTGWGGHGLRDLPPTDFFPFDSGNFHATTVNYPPASAERTALDAALLVANLLLLQALLMRTSFFRERARGQAWLGPALSLGAAVTSVLIMEGALRLHLAAHPVPWRPDAVLQWAPVAHYKGIHGSVYRNNAFGLRSPEIRLERTPGTVRVLVLGDSATWGAEVGPDENWPHQLEVLADTVRPGLGLEVVNGALLGYSSDQARELMPRLLDAYRPDILIFGFNNDGTALTILRDRERVAADPTVKRLQRMLYASELYLLLRREVVNRLGPRSDLRANANRARVSVSDHVANYEAFLHAARGRGMGAAVIIMPTQHAGGYDDADRDLARRRGVPLIDLNEVYARTGEERHALLPDGLHPLPRGHRLLARIVFEHLVKSGLLRTDLPQQWPDDFSMAKESR